MNSNQNNMLNGSSLPINLIRSSINNTNNYFETESAKFYNGGNSLENEEKIRLQKEDQEDIDRQELLLNLIEDNNPHMSAISSLHKSIVSVDE